MTLCRSIVTLLVVALAPSSALAFPDLHTAIGTPLPPVPGGNVWDASCGADRTLPTGPSHIAACGGANCMALVTIPLAQHPDAVCNDGSPGVFYVRPGVGADADKWVVHTQGGGSCRSYEDCFARWCGEQGMIDYNANKMSSDWDHDGVVDLPLHGSVRGMASTNAANDFRTWSHVWMYYCSSDSWMGRETMVDYIDPAALGPSFTMAHRGHTILEAARDLLIPGVTADDGLTTMPRLDEATDVIFSGTSAGAKGALQNVDWFMSAIPTGTNKRLVLDGNMDMTDDNLILGDIWVDYTTPLGDEFEYVLERVTMALDDWAPGGWYDSIDAFVDESCLATYGLPNIDICTYMSQLLTNLDVNNQPLIETESFIRVDLQDPSNSGSFTDPFPTGGHLTVGSPGTPTTLREYTVLMRKTLAALVDHPDNNVTGVYGPRCSQHVGLENSNAFFVTSTPDTVHAPGGWAAVGATVTFHDSLVDWLLGASQEHLDTSDVNAPIVQFSTGC